MKRLSLGVAVAAAVGLLAGPVSAADLPVKAPPVVMPALYNWSGLYVGVEGGAIMGQNSDWEFLNVASPLLGGVPVVPGLLCGPIPAVGFGFGVPGNCANAGHPMHGGFAGGEIGFNWQAPGNRWVFGIEADGNWSELEEALTCPHFSLITGSPGDASCGSRIRDFETVRARIGYALGPTGSFLAFVTGGWATASQSALEAATVVPFPRVEQWQRVNGFIVGGGFEYGITSWLSLKGEAAYVWLQGKDFCFQGSQGPLVLISQAGGCTNITVIQPGFNVTPAHVHDDFVLFRMGLNARFNWGKGKGPAPVVASY